MGTDDSSNGQVDEPDQETCSEVQVESRLFPAGLQYEYFPQLHQEPQHDSDAKSQDEVSRPRLPLISVWDQVNLGL